MTAPPSPWALAEEVANIIRDAGNTTARAQQSADRLLGMSDIGQCRSMLARMIAGHERRPRPSIKLAAFIGTAVGELVEQSWPGAASQVPVTVTLPESANGTVLRVSGTADIVIEDGVVDVKTTGHIVLVQHGDVDFAHRAQVSGYLVGLVQAGHFPDDVEPWAALVYIDRTADEENPHVEIITLDQAYETLAVVVARLDDVTYALAHGIEHAPRDRPEPWCKVACPWYWECRGADESPTDAEGIIDDAQSLTAIDLYQQGKDMEREGKRLADQARHQLKGIHGSTGTHQVYWTHVNAVELPPSTRRAHDRLNIKPIN